MAFEFFETGIPDLTVIAPHQFNDERGAYVKYFEENAFLEKRLPVNFSEITDIVSRKGALRGLHYQDNPSQGKLIHVARGAVFDVALDLREESPSFGKYETFYLYGNQYKAVYIPERFAHGFLVLEDDTVFSYQCAGKYVPENCGGIIWNDKTLNIQWPIEKVSSPLILSEKDQKLQTFDQYRKNREGKKA
jgi:dTDP-4-dehydrorhamnose 3,5-epimerase